PPAASTSSPLYPPRNRAVRRRGRGRKGCGLSRSAHGRGPAPQSCRLPKRLPELFDALWPHHGRDLLAVPEEDERRPELHAIGPPQPAARAILDLEVT